MKSLINANWLQVASIAVAVIIAYCTYIKQKRTTLRLALSDRYQAWKIGRTNLSVFTPYQAKEYYRLYFNLCAEEFDLYNKGDISKTVARDLFDGIRDELKEPLSVKVWEELLSDNYYDSDDFKNFINKIIECYEETKM